MAIAPALATPRERAAAPVPQPDECMARPDLQE
jgi:hypothetical protein